MKYFGIPSAFSTFTIALIVQNVISAPTLYNEDFESEPNLQSGSLISHWNESWNVNPDELGSYFEGDIITTTTDLRSISKNESLRWPDGVVPYIVAGPYTNEGLELLEWAMNKYHADTCVRFKEKQPEDQDYLYITNGHTGCWSMLGRQGGKQEINLQHPGCLNPQRKGTSIHELMHALGIKHEHTRVDRDEHIIVLQENISPDRTINFKKSSDEEVTNHDVPYDFGSVMHYSMFAFSTDYERKPTLKPKIPEEVSQPDGTKIKIGQRDGFGANDIKKLNKMYCPELADNIKPGPNITLKIQGGNNGSLPMSSWWLNVIEGLHDSFV